MGVLMIECPNTGHAVSTGIEIDEDSFASLPDTLSRSNCPLCGAEHVWWKGEAWLSEGDDSSVPPWVARHRRHKAGDASR
jgi:hypothetical protein